MAHRSAQRSGNIPALTGLRFVAAFLVAVAHALAILMNFSDAEPAWRQRGVMELADIGMMLFFVLSGFVIQYNYSTQIVEERSRGILNFMAARFARIYPFYIVSFLFVLLLTGYLDRLMDGNAEAIDQFGKIVPFYLSLTHSWIYFVSGKFSLIYQYPIFSPAWSVSTEWFFYLTYPLICVTISRSLSIRSKLVGAVAITLVWLLLIAIVRVITLPLNEQAAVRFGYLANANNGLQHSFLFWLVYFSPYSRIGEFILGCLTAAIFMDLRGIAVSGRERLVGRFILVGALCGLIALYIALFWRPFPFPMSICPNLPLPLTAYFAMSFSFAPFIALIIFCCARYETPVSKILSSRYLVLCGDASYSLYLLHFPVFSAIADSGTMIEYDFWNVLKAGSRVVAALMVVIGVSLVTYAVIESPARRYARRLLTLGRDTRTAPTSRAVVSWACVILIGVVLPLSLMAWQVAVAASRTSGTINVLSAAHGLVF